MAEAVGTATVDMEQIQLHSTVYQATSKLVSEKMRSLGAILVNQEGKRIGGNAVCDFVVFGRIAGLNAAEYAAGADTAAAA